MVGVSQRYLLDADVLIQAHRAYYRFKFCPGFWESLIWHCEKGAIRSIDKVFDELKGGKDALGQWAKNICPQKFFQGTTARAVGAEYGNLIAWAGGKAQYNAAALSQFAQVADTWLVAFAKANNYVVVTQEESAPNSIASIKIPDVCDAHNVPHVTTYDMLENLGINLHWNSPAV